MIDFVHETPGLSRRKHGFETPTGRQFLGASLRTVEDRAKPTWPKGPAFFRPNGGRETGGPCVGIGGEKRHTRGAHRGRSRLSGAPFGDDHAARAQCLLWSTLRTQVGGRAMSDKYQEQTLRAAVARQFSAPLIPTLSTGLKMDQNGRRP